MLKSLNKVDKKETPIEREINHVYSRRQTSDQNLRFARNGRNSFDMSSFLAS